MNPELKMLANRYGIALAYEGSNGETQHASEQAVRLALDALGHKPNDDAIAEPTDLQPSTQGELRAPRNAQCFMPDWLNHGRLWGIALQLYQLRSERNWGIGDFLDLADVAERAASIGADFVGLNPLHALFLADPERVSPFSPSNRRFLNPIYIAPHDVPGVEIGAADSERLKQLRGSELVDYAGVCRFKRQALWQAWPRWPDSAPQSGAYARSAFEEFRNSQGRALVLHALFEALSEAMVADDYGAGWRSWPTDYQNPESDSVQRFAERNQTTIDFHIWLQWLADVQLAKAQSTARQAGMRIGLYLDLAVGETPDGSAAWADPELTISDLHIGAPPDMYSDSGQDWGLAPLSPAILRQDNAASYGSVMASVMRHAGAIRIDHAMGLYRLFVIPNGLSARDGTYVYLPIRAILRKLSNLSRSFRTIVIGEDLGTVPVGFQRVMAHCEVQSYRVLYFERDAGRIRRPSHYPRKALVCVSTHDLPTLEGWWRGEDIALRRRLEFISGDGAQAQEIERQRDQAVLIGRLKREGLLTTIEPNSSEQVSIELAAALHAHLARAPSRLFAVRLEDLAGERHPVNVPGTMSEYPNWRRKLGLPMDKLFEGERLGRIAKAVRARRPKR